MARLRLYIVIVGLLAAAAVMGVAIHQATLPTKRVWVIHSHELDYEQYEEYNELLRKELQRRGIRAQLSFSYMECNRHIEVDEDRIVRHWIDSVSTQGSWPDLVITTEDQATYALLSTHRAELKNSPILFGGVRFPNYRLLSQYDNVTGIRDTVDFITTMQVVRELSGCQHVCTNLDKGFFDRQVEKMILAQMEGHPILNNLHWHHRMQHIFNLPADSMSLTGLAMREIGTNAAQEDIKQYKGNQNFFWAVGPTGIMHYLLLKFDATSHTLAIMSLRQQFSGINNLFGTDGSGLLAGYFSSIPTWASEQAEMAVQLLRGTPARDLPIQISPKDYYLDWTVAQKYGLTLDQIPARYHIVNLPYRTAHPVAYWTFHILLYTLLIGGTIVAVWVAVRATRKQMAAFRLLKEKQDTLEITSSFTKSFVWHSVDNQVEFDDAFWRYLKQKPHPLTVLDFMKWVHPEYHSLYRQEIIETTTDQNIVMQLQCDFRGSGHYTWWEVRMKGEQDTHGHTKIFGLLFNIDLMKQREQELVEARKRMEEADLKESFLANMSHEIRTPLNAIVGFSNILATPDMELTDEEKAEFVETINRNNDILLKLVNDILDISRIESGYMEFSFEQVEVGTFIDSIYQSYQVQAPKHLEFLCHAGQGAHERISIDVTRAQQILMNFLTNAAKFTPKGSITLGWTLHEEKREVELYVEDTGIGLSKDDCILIFNRFFKKDEFKQGTGLGLSICRVIAERLQGRITVDSELGRGSRFSLWLPLV